MEARSTAKPTATITTKLTIQAVRARGASSFSRRAAREWASSDQHSRSARVSVRMFRSSLRLIDYSRVRAAIIWCRRRLDSLLFRICNDRHALRCQHHVNGVPRCSTPQVVLPSRVPNCVINQSVARYADSAGQYYVDGVPRLPSNAAPTTPAAPPPLNHLLREQHDPRNVPRGLRIVPRAPRSRPQAPVRPPRTCSTNPSQPPAPRQPIPSLLYEGVFRGVEGLPAGNAESARRGRDQYHESRHGRRSPT